ncbi:MFS transporter [Rhodoplanes roseus]|uniref:MFS transporter n=1 Tax=Rhodoplanes roseus TaxID=29409 RepID=A0A327L533_9BRAD|nr:MFS transporter [Rhodoplanes roseus]RAI44642.1 MFS transporter [Rhodoplanes roseus]
MVVFPSIMLPMFLAVVDQTIVATALPAIAASTGQIERAPWVVVAYLIAATVAAPLYGRLGDAFGRRKLMLVALGLFIVTSLLCAVSPTIETLALARVLQGLGGGGLMTLSQALVGEAVPPRERARYQGWLAAVAVTANSFGPVAGGFLTEHFGWQSIFLVNLPISVVAIVLALRLPVRKTEPVEWRSDPLGLMLFAVFVTTTLLSLEQVQRANVAALPFAAALFAAAMLSLVLLIAQERRTPSPLIPLGLLKQPAIWRSDAMAACHGAALVSLITFLPVFLGVVRGASPSTMGLVLVPLTIGIGTGSLITGRMVARTGYTTVFPSVGLALAAVNLVGLAIFAADMSIPALGGMMLWNGFCMGTVMGVVQVTVQSAAGPRRLGEAAASVQFSRSIGAGLGTAMVATVLFGYLAVRSPEAMEVFSAIVQHGRDAAVIPAARLAAVQGDIRDAFRVVFLAIAAFTLGGLALALTNPLRRI